MDYDMINQVYEEIIKIVNNYIKRTKCDYEVARKLSFVLLGYYLVLDPEIFSKLNVLLDAIRIYECQSKEEYREKVVAISYGIKPSLSYNPTTRWDYKYDNNKKFLGGIPYVFYMKDNTIDDVLSLAHEISHGLEGVSATVESEDERFVYIKQSFTTIVVNKENNFFKADGSGFIELVTSLLETRILKVFLELDAM